MTRKKSWTRCIVESALFGHKDYLNYPRKKKKAIKRHFERTFCYSRKSGATIFNPRLLSVPMHNLFHKLYGEPTPTFGKLTTFKRIETT